jgi:hypothetical protein
MIARQWIGETLESDADSYFKYLEETVSGELEPPKETMASACCGKFTMVELSLSSSLCGIR